MTLTQYQRETILASEFLTYIQLMSVVAISCYNNLAGSLKEENNHCFRVVKATDLFAVRQGVWDTKMADLSDTHATHTSIQALDDGSLLTFP